MPRRRDISGFRFGRLTAISPTEKRSGSQVVWECICDCGSVTNGGVRHLVEGRKVSCGCARIAGNQINKKKPRHGHYVGDTPTVTYRIWSGMKSRCLNKRTPQYKYYGGRGIKICERWMDFANFLDDMGVRPAGLSIDRIDNNGDYEPNNCRWATDIQQHRNRSDNVLLTFNKKTLTLVEWEEELGMRYGMLRERLRQGWSAQKSLTHTVMTKSEAAIAGNKVRWG